MIGQEVCFPSVVFLPRTHQKIRKKNPQTKPSCRTFYKTLDRDFQNYPGESEKLSSTGGDEKIGWQVCAAFRMLAGNRRTLMEKLAKSKQDMVIIHNNVPTLAS